MGMPEDFMDAAKLQFPTGDGGWPVPKVNVDYKWEVD